MIRKRIQGYGFKTSHKKAGAVGKKRNVLHKLIVDTKIKTYMHNLNAKITTYAYMGRVNHNIRAFCCESHNICALLKITI